MWAGALTLNITSRHVEISLGQQASLIAADDSDAVDGPTMHASTCTAAARRHIAAVSRTVGPYLVNPRL